MSEERGKKHQKPHETIREIRNGSIRNPTVLAGAQGNGQPVKRARIEMAKTDLHACAIQEPDHLYKYGTLKDAQPVPKLRASKYLLTHVRPDNRHRSASSGTPQRLRALEAESIAPRRIWLTPNCLEPSSSEAPPRNARLTRLACMSSAGAPNIEHRDRPTSIQT